MTEFLLNDCWPNRHHVTAAAAAFMVAVATLTMATLTSVLTSLMLTQF